MSNRKTYVKVYYLVDSIPALNRPEEVREELRNIIRKRLYGEGFVTLSMEPQTRLPSGLELKVVINTEAVADISTLRNIERDFVRTICRDQNTTRTYRISTGIDNSHPGEAKAAPYDPASPGGAPASSGHDDISNTTSDEEDLERRARRFVPADPELTFDRVILPQKTKDDIRHAISILELRKKVFAEWGLYVLDRHPSAALNLYGPPGTGKTMVAEAIADLLGKKILKLSYADISNKFVGEGPKTIRAAFYSAKINDAILFFDEADSLLSQRLTNITNNGDLEVNGMRSEILMQIEQFEGIVIFATNLIDVYDPAVLSRLQCVAIERPDAEARTKIWDVHIKSDNGSIRIPLADDVDTSALGAAYDFSGREIKRAVISTCLAVAERGGEIVRQADFVSVCEDMKAEKDKLKAQQELFTSVARKAVAEQEEKAKEEKAKEEKNADKKE